MNDKESFSMNVKNHQEWNEKEIRNRAFNDYCRDREKMKNPFPRNSIQFNIYEREWTQAFRRGS
jgi:hypothetical protein